MILNLYGVQVEVKQYFGVGTLNVKTTRGEVKAQSTDWIVNFSDGVSCVLPDSTIQRFITRLGPREEVKKEGPQKSPEEIRYEKAVEEIVEKELPQVTETILEIDEEGKVIEVAEQKSDELDFPK